MVAIPKSIYVSEREAEITVRPQRTIFSPKNGEKIGFERQVKISFEKGGVPDWAVPLCEERFPMAGKPPEIPTRRWLSSYDPEHDRKQKGWSDDEYRMILEKLRAKSRKVLEIELPGVEAPWPKYKELVVVGRRTIDKVVEQILAGIETTGVDPEHVVAFERQELNRPEVIEAVEAFARDREGDAEDEPLIAA